MIFSITESRKGGEKERVGAGEKAFVKQFIFNKAGVTQRQEH